jgi:hypothetical protein
VSSGVVQASRPGTKHAHRPSKTTIDDFERVRDVTMLDRRLTVDGVANRLQIMK